MLGYTHCQTLQMMGVSDQGVPGCGRLAAGPAISVRSCCPTSSCRPRINCLPCIHSTKLLILYIYFNSSLIKSHVLAESLDRVLTVSRGGSLHLIGIGNQGQESATRISFYLPWINEQYKKWKKLSLK